MFAISDLHLSFSADKPMDVFGEKWKGYEERLAQNWNSVVGKDDFVLMPGDSSWATYLEDAKEDFSYIENLNGTKIISKGNHDYWWETMSKLSGFLAENNFSTIKFLHNTVEKIGDFAVCGCKGYPETESEPNNEEEKKLYNRELSRLKNGILKAKELGTDRIIVMLHYPPGENTEFARVLREEKVDICVFGHIHGDYFKGVTMGDVGGCMCRLVSCDYLKFMPYLIGEF
ncbi:MAG: metallophosphoesterase [Clostridia bacterium]|nr:metallophosphoesterase [Clostridia bacterium]